MVEQWTHKPLVDGPNPSLAICRIISTFHKIPPSFGGFLLSLKVVYDKPFLRKSGDTSTGQYSKG